MFTASMTFCKHYLPNKVRDLRTSIDHVDFRYDIIGKLPLELVQAVFLNFPLYQAFQARRVSKYWSQVFSAPQTVEALLRPWFPQTKKSLCIPKRLSTADIAALKAEHIDAYLDGVAFSRRTIRWRTLTKGFKETQ